MSIFDLPVEIIELIGKCYCSTLKLVCRDFNKYLNLPCKCNKIKIENWTINKAARNGHLDVVIWLDENRDEGCSKKTMYWAAKNGHLDVVNYLKLIK